MHYDDHILKELERQLTVLYRELQQRKKKHENIERIDNSTLYAGRPMHFYCNTCDAHLIEDEEYITRHSTCDLCREFDWAGAELRAIVAENDRLWKIEEEQIMTILKR